MTFHRRMRGAGLVGGEMLEPRTLLSGSISGVVYNDANQNGNLDPGEKGISEWVVFLDDNHDGRPDLNDVFTSSSGSFSLLNVPPGDHRLRVSREQWWNAVNPTTDYIDLHVADGENLTSENFGESNFYVSGSSISGYVFEDLNGNGWQDSLEGALADVPVYADLNRNNLFDAGEPSTRTNAYGEYWLAGLPAGLYPCRVAPLAGWVQTNNLVFEYPDPFGGSETANLTMKHPGASVTGTVYDDLNGNGKRETGESGIFARTVYADANNNGVLDSGERFTGTQSGFYNLTGLAAGTYKIRQVLPSGWSQTTPANNYGWTVTLATNQTVTGKDFGTRRVSMPVSGQIGGSVWNDLDGDGVRDSSEPSVAGITLYSDANNNSVKDSGEITTITNSNGNYLFSGLAGGAYKIRQILQSGWSQTSPAKNYGWTITLASNQSVTGKDFGTQQVTSPPPPPVGGSIAGTVWNDLDADGVKDSNEVGVGNITLYNDANNNSKLDTGEKTTVTDSSGVYNFTGLATGSYKIRQILQSGWIQTTPANNYGWTITLASNQQLSGKNFGTKQSSVTPPPSGGKISGTIFNDLDGDGVRDSNEIGVGGGWTVYIDLDNDSVLDSNEVFTTTDGSGAWTLSGLAAGTYKVRQVLQAGWKQTSPTNNYGLNVTLTANQPVGGKLFGSRRIA